MTDHIPDATKMVSEPFGYFKTTPCGWTDCAETDEGAVPLYDRETVERLQKALRQTVRTYMVADEAYDPEAETDRCVKYVMEQVK